MDTTEPTNRLIPSLLRQPVFLLWLWVIPQFFLLFLNGWAGWLAIGEMNVQQIAQASWIGGYEFGLLFLGLAVTLVLHVRKRPAGYVLCAIGLLLHIGYLWLFFSRFARAWPSTVAPWMLPQTELIYYQFALIMPAVFYFGFRLACFDMPVRRSSDTALSLGAFFLVPTAWFLLFQLIRIVSRHWTHHRFPETLAIVFFTVSTVFVLMAFMRLMLLLYTWLQEKPWSRFAIPLAAGLLAPLGGLWLNRHIPFPCDFQSTGVYVLTVINGLILLVPTPSSPNRTAWLWLARSVMISFSLYFFVVFLPFMPLSLLAMIAAGAGFLILAPTLLFVIHTRQLFVEGKAIAARWGKPLTILAFTLCLLSIPLGFTLRAVVDRNALNQAMTVAFSPDLQTDRTELNRPATLRALEHLRDMKEGIYLPFLSDYYNKLVFNGMVLPDDKMQLIHRMFFGKEAPTKQLNRHWNPFATPRSQWRGGGRQVLPPRDVLLQEVTVTESQTNDLVRTSLILTLKNQGPASSEFAADIVLPDGVLVSGYWLDVAGHRKPGRIVEKKTAQWVYRMIRVVRRDPGLLLFKNEAQLSLNVFPFNSDETRTTGLELLFPRGLHPLVRIGNREVKLGLAEEESARPLAAGQPDGRVQVILSSAALRQLPSVTRKPYLHFIVDRSAGATNTASELADKVASLAETLGTATSSCRITFANYECADAAPGFIPLSQVRATVAHADDVLPRRGGFCYDRAIAHALLRKQQEGGGADSALSVPLFVVVMARGTVPIPTVDLTAFHRFVPDLPFYYLQTDRVPVRTLFTGHRIQPSPTNDLPRPVVLICSENRVAACLADSDQSVATLPGTSKSLQVFNPAAKSGRDGAQPSIPGGFMPLTAVQVLEESMYTQGLTLWDAYRKTVWAPNTLDDRLKDLVADSRRSGILIPLTSYMVVETSAQEKILTQKEKQAMGTHHALEFDETQNSPEPSILWLTPIALLLLIRRSVRAKRNEPS